MIFPDFGLRLSFGLAVQLEGLGGRHLHRPAAVVAEPVVRDEGWKAVVLIHKSVDVTTEECKMRISTIF